MNDKIISFLKLSELSNDVLIIDDENYFIDTNFDVEIISHKKIEANHYLNLNDFISRRKYPFNYKYKRIIVGEKYLEYLEYIAHLADDNFKLIFILNKNFLPEDNGDLINFMYQDKVKSELFISGNYLLIMCERVYE